MLCAPMWDMSEPSEVLTTVANPGRASMSGWRPALSFMAAATEKRIAATAALAPAVLGWSVVLFGRISGPGAEAAILWLVLAQSVSVVLLVAMSMSRRDVAVRDR